MASSLAETLYKLVGSVPSYSLLVRTNFANAGGDWVAFEVQEWAISQDGASISDKCEIIIGLSWDQLLQSSAAQVLKQFSEVKLILNLTGSVANVKEVYSEIGFHGFIDTLAPVHDSLKLTCYDPLYYLDRCYYDPPVAEADEFSIKPVVDDPQYDPLAPSWDSGWNDPPNTVHGVTLVPVTENGEERWIVPDTIDGNSLYPEAYTNNTCDGAYVFTYTWDDYNGEDGGAASGSYAVVAGTNRRTIKLLGRVWDTGMDKVPNGLELKYPQPLPPSYYQLGTDNSNYIEFVDYTPVGRIFAEWLDVYIEGTNDIEHILVKLLSPVIQGICTSGGSATSLVSLRNHFIRDGVMYDGVNAIARNITGGQPDVLITGIPAANNITTAALGSGTWANGDLFELHHACEFGPRWVDGVHYALTGGYTDRTIWPSFLTVNKYQWTADMGSMLKMIGDLLKNYAPPNYKIFWDHSRQMLFAGYVEETPWNSSTPYYGQAFGKFDDDATADAANSAYTIIVDSSVAAPWDETSFATRVLVRGTNEHPQNLLRRSNIYLMNPGTVGVTGWNAANLDNWFPGSWRAVKKMGQHTFFSYADMVGGGLDGQPTRDNLSDLDTDTCIAWEGTLGIGETNKIAPIFVVDLLAPLRIGALTAWGLYSFRPEFKWKLRFECCETDGLVTAGGEIRYNPDAKWRLMHKDFWDYQLAALTEVKVQSGWLENYCRYILVSMSWAKTHELDYTMAGLSELGIYDSSYVYGEARIADFGAKDRGTNSNASSTIVIDAGGITAAIGDHIVNLTRGFFTDVTSIDSPTQIHVTANGFWQAGDLYAVYDGTNARIGQWKNYRYDVNADPYEWGTGSSVSLVNMPLLSALTSNSRPGYWGSSNRVGVGHRGDFYDNPAFSGTNVCADHAQEILLEMLRSFKLVGVQTKFHPSVRKYFTVIIKDQHTGLSVRAFVDNCTRAMHSTSIDASYFGTGAFTGETPEAL